MRTGGVRRLLGKEEKKGREKEGGNERIKCREDWLLLSSKEATVRIEHQKTIELGTGERKGKKEKKGEKGGGGNRAVCVFANPIEDEFFMTTSVRSQIAGGRGGKKKKKRGKRRKGRKEDNG